VPVSERAGLVSDYILASGLKPDPAERKCFGFNGFCWRDNNQRINNSFIQRHGSVRPAVALQHREPAPPLYNLIIKLNIQPSSTIFYRLTQTSADD